MGERTVASVLSDATETLKTAEFGLADFTGSDPIRRIAGLRNLVVFGRAVTNVLQNLRSVVGADVFNKWYEPVQAEMKLDEVMRFFYEMRTEILKEGTLKTFTSNTVNFSGAQMAPILSNPPRGAKAFFIGDQLNGAGWNVELPDGSIEKYYVTLPEGIRTQANFHFPAAPTSRNGETIADNSAEGLARLYMDSLRSLLERAKAEFA
jgi:hypothetical protein